MMMMPRATTMMMMRTRAMKSNYENLMLFKFNARRHDADFYSS